jgi:hypothetical protein
MAFVFDGGVCVFWVLSGTCGASGRSLVGDFRQALNDNTVKIKGYNDRIDLDSEGHVKPVLHGGLLSFGFFAVGWLEGLTCC